MSEDVSRTVADILEQAAEARLEYRSQDGYETLLLHVGGLRSFCRYDGSEDYWERVQVILDCFFTAAERAEIGTRLIEDAALRARPEARAFLARVLAERQLQRTVLPALQDRPTAARRSPPQGA